MPKRVVRCLLPFSFLDNDREKDFTKEMEMATILSLVESEREKDSIFKKDEELIFIAEACYPLWLVSWEKRNLLFDGFNVVKYKTFYDELPDVQVCIDEVKESVKTREVYSALLSDYLNYFQAFSSREERIIDGLIDSIDFIQDFMSYFPEVKIIRNDLVNKIVLSPTLDISDITSSLHEFSDLIASLKRDVRSLRQIMKLISVTTKNNARVIRQEIRKTQKNINKKLSIIRPSITKKRQEIKKDYNQRITKKSREFDKKLRRLHQTQVKIEKTKQRLIAEIERCEAEIRVSRLRKDDINEVKWRTKRKECKKEVSILNKNIRDMEKKIESTNATKRFEISKLQAEFDFQAEAVSGDLREIEASREAGIRMRQLEMKTLEDLSSKIISQVHRLLVLKEAAIKQIEGTGIPKNQMGYTLTYIPFYLTCYQRDMRKRYVVYPPSFASSMKVLTKFKGFFGASKIYSLLKPCSMLFSNLINQIVPLIRNPVFEKEIIDTGTQVNILKTKESRESIKKGLEELKSEGWISESEFSELISILSKQN